jgi:hypothetical protein
MELVTKPDWREAQERIDAWWQGEIIDRAAIQIRAPKKGLGEDEWAAMSTRGESIEDREELFAWYTDPEQVIPRLNQIVDATYWGGEAFPVVFPVSISLVAITAAYLGCPYDVHPGSGTGWADPIIEDWAQRPTFTVNPDNEWWRRSEKLLEAAGPRAPGRYYIGVPDLNGPPEILALLRGTEELALDLMDVDPGVIKDALDEVNLAWLHYWEACNAIIHEWVDGYLYWIGIWSDRPSIDLQNDFSCLISPRMFEEIFLPALDGQTRWVERTVYHLDGPGAVRHLDALLSLPELDGIQWVPGAGAPPASEWIPLLRRIQAGGKLLQTYCEPREVEVLLAELAPEGLLLTTSVASEEEANKLLKDATRWTARRNRVAT